MGGRFGWHGLRRDLPLAQDRRIALGCLLLPVAAIVAVYLSGLGIGGGWMAAAGLLAFAAAQFRLRQRGSLLGVWTAPHGLSVWRWRRARQRVSWGEVTSVVLDADGLRLGLGGDELRLPAQLNSIAAIAAEAGRHLRGPERDAADVLEPAKLAEVLGLPASGKLEAGSPTPSRRYRLVESLLLTSAVAVTPNWRHPEWPSPWLSAGTFGLFWSVAHLSCIHWHGSGGWRATVDGLEILDGCGSHVRWDQLQTVEPYAQGLLLRTDLGDILVRYATPRLDDLRAMLNRLLAARAAGVALPRLGAAVPDTALSRAETVVADERGLSRSEGQA